MLEGYYRSTQQNKENAKNLEDVLIKPNPAYDFLDVKIKNSLSHISQVVIRNTLSEIVLNKNVKAYHLRFDISFLRSGAYSIEISTLNNTFTRKFLVIR